MKPIDAPSPRSPAMADLPHGEDRWCAYPGCQNVVTDDDRCYGCASHICEAHSLECPMGSHDPEAHWCPDDDWMDELEDEDDD